MKPYQLLGSLLTALLTTTAGAGTLELIGMEVDTFSGNGMYLANDLRILPWSGVPVEFTRIYRTGRSEVGGALGPGWSHSYSSHLEATTNGVQLVSDVGILFYFSTTNRAGSTQYIPDLQKGAGNMMQLTNSAVGDVVATAGDHRRYVYYPLNYANPSLRGKLREIVLPYSTNASIRCTYDGSGRLVTILDRISGRGFVLTYGTGAESALLVDIAENFQLPGEESARHCAFSYQDGRLVRATSKGGLPDETYEYSAGKLSRITCGSSRDSYIRYNSLGYIASIHDMWNSPRDAALQPVPITFSYEADDVVRIRWDDGKDVRLETRLADVPGAIERTRTTVDPVARTTRTESWTVDKLTGDILKEVDADGKESTYQYTANSVSLRQRLPGMVAKEIWRKTYDFQGALLKTENTGAGGVPEGVVSNRYIKSRSDAGEDGGFLLISQQSNKAKGAISCYDHYGRVRYVDISRLHGSRYENRYYYIGYHDSVEVDGDYAISISRSFAGSLLVVSNIMDASGRLQEFVTRQTDKSESEIRYSFKYDRADNLLQVTRTKWIPEREISEDGPYYTYYTNEVVFYEAHYDADGRRIQESVLGERCDYSYQGLRRNPAAETGNHMDFEQIGLDLCLFPRRDGMWPLGLMNEKVAGTSMTAPPGWINWISLAGVGW